MADEAAVDEGVELDTPAGEAPDASDDAADPTSALKAFDAKLVDELLKTPPTDAKGKGAAGAEAVEESPAERNAGAASDDDEEDADDPSADLRAEVEALREELRASREQGKGSTAILEAAVSESPEIQQLESEMRAAEQETRTAHNRAVEIVGEYRKLEGAIFKLEGKLEVAADVDKLDIRDELREKRRELKDLETEHREKVREAKSGDAAQKKLAVHKADEIARIKQALAKRTTDAEADKAAQRAAKASFNTAFKTEAEKYGIDATRDKRTGKLTDSKARHIEEVLKARVTLHLRRLQAQDPNAPAVDVEELTSKYWKDEATNRGLTSKKAFTAASTERRESRAGATPRGARSASPSPLSRLPKETLQDGQFWKDRAARLAGESS